MLFDLAEFAFYNLIQKGMILLGMQRVHSISRLKTYGQSVYMLGRKEELHIGTIPAYAVDRYKEIVENLFSIKTDTLPNYLNVTLTPSNPNAHRAYEPHAVGSKQVVEDELFFFAPPFLFGRVSQ